MGVMLQAMGDLYLCSSGGPLRMLLHSDGRFWATTILTRAMPQCVSAQHCGRIDPFAEAKAFFEQALTIQRRALGEQHPTTAECLARLGGLLIAVGDFAGAKIHIEQALSIQREVLGEEHPLTATSYNNLGFLLQSMGDLEGARPHLESALAVSRTLLGDNHLRGGNDFVKLSFEVSAPDESLGRGLAPDAGCNGTQLPNRRASFRRSLGEAAYGVPRNGSGCHGRLLVAGFFSSTPDFLSLCVLPWDFALCRKAMGAELLLFNAMRCSAVSIRIWSPNFGSRQDCGARSPERH